VVCEKSQNNQREVFCSALPQRNKVIKLAHHEFSTQTKIKLAAFKSYSDPEGVGVLDEIIFFIATHVGADR